MAKGASRIAPKPALTRRAIAKQGNKIMKIEKWNKKVHARSINSRAPLVGELVEGYFFQVDGEIHGPYKSDKSREEAIKKHYAK